MGVYYVQQEHTNPVYVSPKPVELPFSIRSNCYAYAEYVLGDLPSMATLQKTATPSIGNVAVFMYPNGVPHVALVLSSTANTLHLREANFHAGKVTERTIFKSDPALVGFFSK